MSDFLSDFRIIWSFTR